MTGLWLSTEGGAASGMPSAGEFDAGPDDRRPGVLIVEDEALVALHLERIVTEAGLEVVALVDTEEDAVAAARRLAPDVVLMDIRLRKGDGVAAARTIRMHKNLPVIFVSANVDPSTIDRIGGMERASLLRKPFNERDLVTQLRAALAGR